MYCNRHCTKSDYEKLKIKTSSFLNLLKKDDPLFLEYGQELVELMIDYDQEIAHRFSSNLNKEISHQELYVLEERIIEELLRNVMVDVYEHQEK